MENISCNNGNLIGGRPEISQVKMPGLPKDSLHEFFQDQIKMRVSNEMFKHWTDMSNTYGKWLYNLKYKAREGRYFGIHKQSVPGNKYCQAVVTFFDTPRDDANSRDCFFMFVHCTETRDSIDIWEEDAIA